MVSPHHKFIRLLQLEIESMHDEIELIMKSLDERLAKHEITEFVRNENCAVLRNELLGLEDFLRTEFSFDERSDISLGELVKEVRAYLRRRLSERQYVPALYELVSRRIDKIVAYLEESNPVS